MNKVNQRFNQIVTKALQTSVLSQETHNQYYKASYKYGMKNPCEVPYITDEMHMINEMIAYVDPNKNKQDGLFRLVLDMRFGNRYLVSSIHHELIHVNQIAQSIEHHIPLAGGETKLVDLLTQTLVWEAQASTGQVEGPLFHFFNDLEMGNTENVEFYKDHFLQSDLQYDGRNYLGALLEIKPSQNGKMNLIDMAGHFYMNGFSRMSATEKYEAKREARKKTIAGFFTNNCTDMKDIRVPTYTSCCLSEVFRIEAQKITLIEENKKKYGPFAKLDFGPAYPLPMRDILRTTFTQKEEFLSEKDWHEILEADNNTQFANRIMFNSSLWDKYQDALKMGL